MLDALDLLTGTLYTRCPNCLRRHPASTCYYCGVPKETNMTVGQRKNLIKDRANKKPVATAVPADEVPHTPTTKVAEGPAPSKKSAKLAAKLEKEMQHAHFDRALAEDEARHRADLEDMHAQSNLDADEVTEQVEHDAAHAKRQALQAKQKAHEASQDAPSAKKPKAAKEKTVVDANVLSVSDVAREQGVDPKAARAKLRKVRGKAEDGRWAKVQRDSKEHAELIAIITADKDEE